MTSLAFNTPATTVNTVLSIPTSSFDKKTNTSKSLISYTVTQKNWYRKSPVKFSSIDWDLNMNELEFE